MLAAVRTEREAGGNADTFWLTQVGLLLRYLVQMVCKQPVITGDNSYKQYLVEPEELPLLSPSSNVLLPSYKELSMPKRVGNQKKNVRPTDCCTQN